MWRLRQEKRGRCQRRGRWGRIFVGILVMFEAGGMGREIYIFAYTTNTPSWVAFVHSWQRGMEIVERTNPSKNFQYRDVEIWRVTFASEELVL
jgi:hypothetical protein